MPGSIAAMEANLSRSFPPEQAQVLVQTIHAACDELVRVSDFRELKKCRPGHSFLKDCRCCKSYTFGEIRLIFFGYRASAEARAAIKAAGAYCLSTQGKIL